MYLYEAAANMPERQNLENIRRGQFEGLRDEIARNPARHPDFGEPRLHPTAGATVVGARKFLIAYNIYLNTPEVEIAKKVAKAVRFSSGGLRFVKGMGVPVRGLAQVSMNLTDFEQTPVARVYEFVKREAARYGVVPLSSEIVGLIPKKALEAAAEWFLQIENFDSSLILEEPAGGGDGRGDGSRRTAYWRGGFYRAVGSADGHPGGGSAAAAAAAMAAAMATMVAGMSRGERLLALRRRTQQCHGAPGELREELKSAIDADAAAFNGVMRAYRQAKASPDGAAALLEATKAATIAAAWGGGARRRDRAAGGATRPITNPRLASDLTVSEALAQAAVRGRARQC